MPNAKKETNLSKENFYLQSKDRQMLPIENGYLKQGPVRYYINDTNSFNYLNDNHKTSYFFKDKIDKREDHADKYLMQKKYPNKKKHPGPGYYDLKVI